MKKKIDNTNLGHLVTKMANTFVNKKETYEVESYETTELESVPVSDVHSLSTTDVQSVGTTSMHSVGTSEMKSTPTAEVDSADTAEVDSADTAEVDAVDTSNVNAVPTSEFDTVPTSELEMLTISVNGEPVETEGLSNIDIAEGENVTITNEDGVITISSSGAVETVDLEMPTGFEVDESSFSETGEINVTYTEGYSMPTDSSQGKWNQAYGWGDHSQAGYLTPQSVTDMDASLNWNTKTKIATVGDTDIHVALPQEPNTSVTDMDASLNWNTKTKIATVAGTDIHVTLPEEPVSDTHRPIKVNGTQILGSDSSTALDFVAGNNVSITNVDGVVTFALDTSIDTLSETFSGTTLLVQPDRYYRAESAIITLTIVLPAISGPTVKSMFVNITTGTTPLVTFSSADGKLITYYSTYTISGQKEYEISIVYNGSKWVISSAELVISA
jgi:hypothetical protein